MGVVVSKNWALADRGRGWDKDAAEDRIRRWAGGPDKEDVNWSKYRSCFLWYDEDNPENFTSYKFAYVDIIDGEPHVVFRALAAIIAVLNGARGGTNIPEADRKGVYNQAAKQYRRFDEEPPELKDVWANDWETRVGAVLNRRNKEKLAQACDLIQEVLKSAETESDAVRYEDRDLKIERRFFPMDDLELRVEDRGGRPKIRGYAAMFDKLSLPLAGMREKIARGAFAKTIEEDDIRALWNHDSNFVLGRNRSGTLKLTEDDRGLFVEIDPPEAQWAKDLMESIKRGDVSQMSFGFIAQKDDWLREDGKDAIRTLLEVKLFDVSPVTFPAYPQTSVKVRAVFTEAGIDWDKLADVIHRAQRGQTLSADDRGIINASIGVLRSYLSSSGPDGAKGQSSAGGESTTGRLALLRKRLEIAERAI